MPPIVHCVRHAQGTHNLSPTNKSHFDPSLTRFGEEQCRNLNRIFPYHKSVELLVSSPLLRCIQTTLLSFPTEVSTLSPVICHPLAQEIANTPCDTGRDPEDLQKLLGSRPVDLSLVHEGWNRKQGIYEATIPAVQDRARVLRQWLRERPEKEIVLVCHGGFLHYFTQEWEGSERMEGSPEVGTSWANCEWRSFEFVGDGDNCGLTETTASKKERATRAKKLVNPDDEMLAAERKAGALGQMKARQGGPGARMGIAAKLKASLSLC